MRNSTGWKRQPARDQWREVLEKISCPEGWCKFAEAAELGAMCACAAVEKLREIFVAVRFQLQHIWEEWEMEFLPPGDPFVTLQFSELAERGLIEMRAMRDWARRFEVGGPTTDIARVIALIAEEFYRDVYRLLLDAGKEHQERQESAVASARALLRKCEELEGDILGWYDTLRDDMDAKLGELEKKEMEREGCGCISGAARAAGGSLTSYSSFRVAPCGGLTACRRRRGIEFWLSVPRADARGY